MNSTLRNVTVFFFLNLLYITILQAGVQAQKGGCDLEEVTLKQTFLGKDRDGFEVYSVTLTNQCTCKVIDLLLSCDKGFKPHSIDPSDILTQEGRTCKVNRDIEGGKSVSFVYKATKMWPDLEVVLVGCLG